jgi:hypothetical protein
LKRLATRRIIGSDQTTSASRPPKRRHDPRPERESAEAEFKLQIQRDLQRAIHNHGKWINAWVKMDERCGI